MRVLRALLRGDRGKAPRLGGGPRVSKYKQPHAAAPAESPLNTRWNNASRYQPALDQGLRQGA